MSQRTISVYTWQCGDREVGNLAYYACTQPRRQQPRLKPTRHSTKPSAGAYILSFGKYAGQSLKAIAWDVDDGQGNLAYLDWLVDQDWLRPGTRHAIARYLSEPQIAAELTRKFGEFDIRCQRDGYFIPSLQTTPLFNLGKPERLRRLWPGQSDEPQSDDPPTRIKSMTEAWDLAADLAIAIDNSHCVEELQILDPRLDDLKNWLPLDTMKALRSAYQRRSETVDLIALLPQWKRDAAEELLTQIDLRPDLEDIARREGGEVYDAAELLRLQSV